MYTQKIDSLPEITYFLSVISLLNVVTLIYGIYSQYANIQNTPDCI